MDQEKQTVILRIDGKKYKVTGTDSLEQFQAIETLLDQRMKQVRSIASLHPMGNERMTMLMAINLADDYLKSVQKAEEIKQQSKKDGTRQGKGEKRLEQLQKTIDRLEEQLLELESENQELADQLKKREGK